MKTPYVSALVLVFLSGVLLSQGYKPAPDARQNEWLELLLRQPAQNPFDPVLQAKAARDEFARKLNAVQYAMNDVVYDFNANIRNDKRFEVADRAIDAMRKDPGWGTLKKRRK